MQKKLDKLNLVLDEGLTGVRVIRAFDRIEHEKRALRSSRTRISPILAINVNRIVAALMPVHDAGHEFLDHRHHLVRQLSASTTARCRSAR